MMRWLSRRTAGIGVVLVLACGLASARAQAQQGRWTAHTSLREITSLSVSPEAVWASTTGGVFSYRPASGEIQRYTIAEGLTNISARAVSFDAGCGEEGCVWIGYADGVIDRLDVARGTVEAFRDVARAERYSMRQINRLVTYGDTLFVATSFGLVVFDPVRLEVRDTYDQLGSIDPATPVHDVAVAPTPDGRPGLWLATDQGVAHAPLGAVNLKDPAAWTVEREGLPSVQALSVEPFAGQLYVGSGSDLSVRQADGTYRRLLVADGAVRDLFATDALLLGAGARLLVAVDPSGAARPLPADGFTEPVEVVVGPEGDVWFGDRQEGLVQARFPAPADAQLEVVRSFYPEGPYHNLFESLDFDRQGNLWAGGAFSSGAGFYVRTPEGLWTDYISRIVPALQGRERFTRIHAAADGSAWAGAQGGGLAEVTPEGAVHVYDRHNSSLRGAEGTTNPDFILIGGIGSDAQGNVWVTARDSPHPLHLHTPDGTWTSFPLVECDGLTPFNATYDEIFVDSFGQKWIIVVDKANLNRVRGLAVVDTGDLLEDGSDDTCQFYGQPGSNGEGLPSVVVTAVVEDRDGLIWIGTDKGLAYIINHGIVAADRNTRPIWPQHADRTQGVYLFQGLKVNDLAVDPANRIWAATDEGVWLVEPQGGGYEVAAHFTAAGSPLFSDVVVSVAVDGRTGDVYFSTDLGLVSYQGEAVDAAEERRALLVYPNPVRVAAGAEATIYIEGLVEETEILILAPHGEVVDRFPARGGRVRWDGRDRNRQPVPSGVYLVVAVGRNGEGAAYGKVAVIR